MQDNCPYDTLDHPDDLIPERWAVLTSSDSSTTQTALEQSRLSLRPWLLVSSHWWWKRWISSTSQVTTALLHTVYAFYSIPSSTFSEQGHSLCWNNLKKNPKQRAKNHSLLARSWYDSQLRFHRMSACIVCAGICALKQEAQCDLLWWEAALLSQQRSLLHGLWIAEKPTRGALTLNPLNWLLLYYHTSPIPGGNRLSSPSLWGYLPIFIQLHQLTV